MNSKIEEYQEKINKVRLKSLSQVNSLQSFLQQQLFNLADKIEDKITNHNKQIQSNIDFYHQIPENDPLKGYFGNMLQSQLAQEIEVLDVEDQQDQQIQNPSQGNNLFELDDQQTHQQKQLKEVYSILKKAINLFSEQYSNSIQSLNNNLVDFKLKNIDYKSDFCLSQDRQHANILIQNQNLSQKQDNISDKIEMDQIQNQSIRFSYLSRIDLQSESPSHLPPQYHFSHVKCFSVLDDNRRAVLCTRNNLVLIDIQKSKVIKYTQLRGAIPTLPTCIQPLYSYEYDYQEIVPGQQSHDQLHSQIIYNQGDDQQNSFSINGNIKINGKEEGLDIESSSIQKENQNKKRVRKQNLIAVGTGSLSQTIDISIYSLKTLQKIIRLPGHLRTICKFIQPPLDYEMLFSISSDKKIFVWNLTQANPVLIENTSHAQSVNDALILNDKLLATFSLNGEVFLWDIEYTNEFPYKFKNLKKKMIIQRSCLSLFIGQVVMSSDRFYFSITSQGITEQKYYLEMNDYSNRILVKQELPSKVIGLNILSVNMEVYAIITYSSSNFFDVYKIDTLSPGQKKVTLHQTLSFPSQDLNINTVIESPRVQFIQTVDSSKQMLIAFALDQNISFFSISLV